MEVHKVVYKMDKTRAGKRKACVRTKEYNVGNMGGDKIIATQHHGHGLESGTYVGAVIV